MINKTLLDAGQSPFGWHRIQTFMHCPTKYYHSYIGKEPREVSQGLIRGSLLHTGLAHHYALMQAQQQGKESDLFEPIEAMKQQSVNEDGEWLNEVTHCIKVLEEYLANEEIKEWEKNLIILSVEEVFAIEIEGYTQTQRADLVVKDTRDNKVYIIDHKTSAQIRKDTTKGYQTSGQVIGFWNIGHNLWGDNFGGLIINYVQHGGKRKTPKIKFERQMVEKSESHINAFASSVYFYRKLIDHYESRELKHYPRVQSEFTCMHKYGSCPYYDKCFNA